MDELLLGIGKPPPITKKCWFEPRNKCASLLGLNQSEVGKSVSHLGNGEGWRPDVKLEVSTQANVADLRELLKKSLILLLDWEVLCGK